MDTALFNHFLPVIRSLTAADLAGAPALFEKLTLFKDGDLRVCYAPFEYVNDAARVVIVGITPGRTQMLNALREAQRQTQLGANDAAVLRAAKSTGAFSGPMRPNLTDMLNAIGIHDWLGISSCDALFGKSAHLVQTTSVLRNPVFVNNDNYNGTPGIMRHPILRTQVINGFAIDAASLPNAVFVPLGDKVADALNWLAAEGHIAHDRLLNGLPHPSGANAERIAYFLGRKAREQLSIKTSASKIDEIRRTLQRRVLALA